MHKKKFFAKLVLASVLTGGINFLPAVPIFHAGNFQVSVAHAEIKTFAAKNTAMTDVESLTNAAKSTAQERALNLAQKKAETFLKTLSPTLRGRLTDEDISAVVINNFKIVNTPLYRKLYYQAVDENGNDLGRNGEIYEATVTINIDTAALDKYRKLGAQDREKLIKQAQNAQAAFEEIDRDFEELRKNSRTKSPKQLQADINKFDAKISKAEKSRKKNQSATPPAIVQDKPAITENKPAPPVTNQPMQFSQPVEIGGIGFPIQAPYHGYVVKDATNNNGESYFENSKLIGKPFYSYTRGTARWGDGEDALYCNYNYNNNSIKFGGKNNYIIETSDTYKRIFRINTNSGITLYNIWQFSGYTIFNIIGRQKDGKWVSYIDCTKIAKTYFGGHIAYKKRNGVFYYEPKFQNDTIIVKYENYTDMGKMINQGEFRFKWDEKAQWFGVEQIKY